MKVSVIVPVYNVEKYLSHCLHSIMNQSLSDIEIIAANDGSTDNSLELLREIASKDERIRIISHPNMGLGPTRNDAIKYAQGEYLAFVDSDDYIECEALQIMYDKAKSIDADVVQAETMMFDDNKAWKRADLVNIEDIQLDENNIDYFLKYYYFSRDYSHNAWDKLYKRSFVVEHGLLFGDNKKIFAEDNWFQLQIFFNNPKIAFIATPFYWYRQQEESIMHKPKLNLLSRHGQMIADYYGLIQEKPNRGNMRQAMSSTLSLLSFDILVIELWNQKIAKGGLKDYLKALQGIVDERYLYKGICSINKNHAYTYEASFLKKIIYRIVSFLYSCRMIKIANTLMWGIYKFR